MDLAISLESSKYSTFPVIPTTPNFRELTGGMMLILNASMSLTIGLTF